MPSKRVRDNPATIPLIVFLKMSERKIRTLCSLETEDSEQRGRSHTFLCPQIYEFTLSIAALSPPQNGN